MATKKLSPKNYTRALVRTLKLAYTAAPLALYIRIADIIISAAIPLILTILASQTATSLVDLYNGIEGALPVSIAFVVATALAGLVMIMWSNISSYLDRIIRFKVELGISTAMFLRFTQLDFWRYDDKETIDTYDKAVRFSNLFSYTYATIGRIISDVVAVVVSIVALMFINPFMSLIVLVAVIPGIVVQVKLARKQAAHWDEHIKHRRESNYIEYHLLQPAAVSELRIYNIVPFLLERRKKLVKADEKGSLLIEKRSIKWQLLSSGILSIAEIISLVWIVLLIAAKEQAVGQFIFVQQMVSRALTSATAMAASIGRLDEDLANLSDYDTFMNIPLQESDKPSIGKVSSIRIENLSFTYPSASRETLKNVSFDIPVGSHIAIVGENGAGKSTLIKLLLGLYKPSEGRVLVNEQGLSSFDPLSWHNNLGVLQQDFIRYQTSTIRENITYGNTRIRHSKDSRIHEAMVDSDSANFVDKLSHGLDTRASNWYLDEDESEAAMLSGGQWQRIALARNFYRRAPIIILDEPTSAIDAVAESKIFKRLLLHRKDQTIITISHRLTTVQKADMIIVLKDGEVAEMGTHTELVTRQGEYMRMFEEQLYISD